MKKRDIYIGTILKNENNKIETFQNYNQLLDLGNGFYVNLDWIRTVRDKIKLYKGLITNKFSDEIILKNTPPVNGIFVDEESLVDYYDKNKNKNIGVNRAQKDKLMDVRIPGGVEVTSEGHIVYYKAQKNPNKHEVVHVKRK